MVGSGWSVRRCASAMPGARPAATAPAAAPIKVLRLKKRCSGVARLSGISQPRRRMTFMGLIPPEWLWKAYGHAGSLASHGCGRKSGAGGYEGNCGTTNLVSRGAAQHVSDALQTRDPALFEEAGSRVSLRSPGTR